MIFDLRKDMNNDDANALRAVFMGTGAFALPILKQLDEMPGVEIVATVTQPNKKIGRGSGTQRTNNTNEIKEFTLVHGGSIIQPKKLDGTFIDSIKAIDPDIIIVAAYGRILPQALLDIPKHGCLNVHGSLLPKLRGASPIQNALIDGLTETGVTLMEIDAGLDTGNIIASLAVPIEPADFTKDLEIRMAAAGAELITGVLPKWIDGSIKSTPQNDEEATICQIIDRSDGRIDWMDTTINTLNKYRGLTPWPGLFCFWEKSATEKVRLKITGITNVPEIIDVSAYAPGHIFELEKRLFVRTLDHAIEITSLQKDGGTSMAASDFLNGNPDLPNSQLL